MLKIRAEELLKVTADEVARRCKGRFELIFHDGSLITAAHATILSSYYWNFHRLYPRTPLSIRHHIDTVRDGKRLSTRHAQQINRIIRWDVHDTYCRDPDYDFDKLDQDMYYVVTAGVYNASIMHTSRYVNSLDMLDLLEVAQHPPLWEAREASTGDEASIAIIYQAVRNSLLKDPLLAHNRVAKIARSGLANMSQIEQIVGTRGYATDLSQYRFPISIRASYLDGMHTFYESGVESRQASVALGNSKGPLEKSEYQNRRFQLIGMYVQTLHDGDCGSTHHYHHTVMGETVNELGEVVVKDDLEFLVGKYYLDDDDVMRTIHTNDKHLIGRTLRIRSPGHCQHRDTAGVCETCFGAMSDNILRSDNLGQICTAFFGQKISQNLLSTKHLLVSVIIAQLSLTAEQMAFLELTSDRLSYLLHDTYENTDLQIVIDAAFAANFADLHLVEDVEQLSEMDMTELPWIGIMIDGNFQKINLNIDGRRPSFTYAMLDHIRKMKVEIDSQNRYIIPMRGYDWSEPIMTVPKRSYDMSDYAKRISTIVESRKEDLKKGNEPRTFDNVLQTLFRHVVTRMEVNIVNLEILLYAFTIRDRERGDYSISKSGPKTLLGVKTEVFNYRSASAILVFEKQRDVINNPWNYIHHNVMDHPFDAVFLPDKLFPNKR